ncbi:MAG: hypothetical protein AB1491_14470 [Thermodesulfobacteriota bacterium]
MKPIREMSLGELAAFISSHLSRHGIEVVLSGGSCVTIYSQDQYVSLDLDFIERFAPRKKLREALAEIGFFEEARYFKHPDTKFFLEFPKGPLAVGREPVREVISLEFSTGPLKIISPTDCVKDRLAGFYHWQDRQCLEQAILVATTQEIDMGEIERWSKVEGKLGEFRKIKKLLAKEKL